MKNYHNLTGKTAMVTGGSRGLGREIALGLAACGANVVVASRKLENCRMVTDAIGDMGRRALPIACHVGQWNQLDHLVEQSIAEFGRIDILVNNAGMSPIAESSIAVSEELFDKIIGVNFKGPFRLAALLGTHMVANGGGSIINISSIGAEFPGPTYAPYAGAKSGLNTITVAMAQEFGPTVRVNAIMPGSFRTDISRAWPASKEQHTPAALRRFGEPEEILSAVLYLASDYSSFTTGSILRVDGGRYAP